MNCIASERVRMGLSQEELGRKIGVERKTVSEWERGLYLPAKRVKQLADFFDCSADYLLRKTDERKPHATSTNS